MKLKDAAQARFSRWLVQWGPLLLLGLDLTLGRALWGAWQHDRYLSAHGIQAQAVVTDVRSRGTSYVVTFTAEGGRQVRQRVYLKLDWPPRGLPAEGDRIAVEYDPNDPQDVRRAGDHGDVATTLVFLLVSLSLTWLARRAIPPALHRLTRAAPSPQRQSG